MVADGAPPCCGWCVDAQQRWYGDNIDLRGRVVVDVGANVGRLSEFFWKHGDDHTRVISVEPLPQNLACLRERVNAVGNDRWRVEACAVSSAEGTVWLESSHDEKHGWNAAVRPGPGNGLIEVPCRRLSGLVPEATVVKIDVEGHEYAILEEALGAMPGVRVWAVELHMVAGHPLQVTLKAFADRGYRVVAAGRAPDDPEGPWRNVPVPSTLGWERIPVAQRRSDGSIFKMLHIIAIRPEKSIS
jgi:FkbM family methyltransferase